MVCHSVVLLRFSATTPAYHAVSPTVAAIFISRLCVCCQWLARARTLLRELVCVCVRRALTSNQEGGRAKMTCKFKLALVYCIHLCIYIIYILEIL